MATINDETYIIWGDEENGYEINEMKTRNYLKEFQKLLSNDLSKREIQELLTDVEEGLQTDGMFYFNFSNEQGYDSFVGVCVKKKYRKLKQMLEDMRDDFESSLDESYDLSILTESNKYFFGTGSTKEVKKLFESTDDGGQKIVMKNVIQKCAKDFNKYLLKLAQRDKKSVNLMIQVAIKCRILNGRQPWEGMDMVLSLFEEVTDYVKKIDMNVSYPFVSEDGDTVESKEDLYPASLPYIDEMLEKYCTTGFTALYNVLHPEETMSKVDYNTFCGESHETGNITLLGR